MKNILLLSSVILSVVLIAKGQDLFPSPLGTVIVHVITEQDEPIPNAEVSIGFMVYSKNMESISKESKGLTDSNGIYKATSITTDKIYITGTKDSYYPNYRSISFNVEDYDDDLSPWKIRRIYSPDTLEEVLVLKEMRNPIPMYAKKINRNLPNLGSAVGYDLVQGDWVSPHGEGRVSDLLITFIAETRERYDYDTHLMIRFSNEGDGIQPYYIDNMGSQFKSDHMAPQLGYTNAWEERVEARMGHDHRLTPEKNDKRNFYLRVRTRIDENGNIVSALYGKIYAERLTYISKVKYYLNPTPNDRNMEFDPKRNMFTDLQVGEEVQEP